LGTVGRQKQALGAADKGIAAFIEAQEFLGGMRDADANAFSDSANGKIGLA